MYRINKADGYVVGVVSGVDAANSNATEEEFLAARSLLLSPPVAPDGHVYRLRENLEWELCAMVVPEIQAEATEADFIAALGELGVAL